MKRFTLGEMCRGKLSLDKEKDLEWRMKLAKEIMEYKQQKRITYKNKTK